MFRLITTLLVAYALGVAGCRGHSSPPATESPEKETMGTIEGRVTIGPLRPGPTRVGDTETVPPELYASHKIVVLSQDQTSKIAEASIDWKGNYRAEVPAGNYFIDFSPRDIGLPRSNPPRPVSVEAGKITHFDVGIDTGMR